MRLRFITLFGVERMGNFCNVNQIDWGDVDLLTDFPTARLGKLLDIPIWK